MPKLTINAGISKAILGAILYLTIYQNYINAYEMENPFDMRKNWEEESIANDAVKEITKHGSIITFNHGEIFLWGMEIENSKLSASYLVGKYLNCLLVYKTDDKYYADCDIISLSDTNLNSPLDLYTWMPEFNLAVRVCNHEEQARAAKNKSSSKIIAGTAYRCNIDNVPIRQENQIQ
ncbi:MAG TPA: hypothetical protein PK486_01365 [Trichococcus flocculiformis]|nr:hypothetical protein [Trichococcus flocculiformis]